MDIVVQNLTKKYGLQRAVDNISFKVNTGEVLGFLGPNGAGKTTTMKAITTYLVPNEGDIMVGEFSVLQQPEEVKRHIGYLPELNPLYDDMYVVDYLKFIARLHGVEKSQISARVLKMIETCGIFNEKHKKIRQLSKGFQQRVGLAQALIHNPDVLILDEPTTGLDPNQRVEIRELIRNIGREKTVLLSSHVLAEVEATCDRILIINKGKIVADGTPDELRKRSQDREIVKVIIEDGEHNMIYEALRDLETVHLVDTVEKARNSYEVQSKAGLSSCRDIFKLCVANNWIITQMTPIETRLEDVFRELTIDDTTPRH